MVYRSYLCNYSRFAAYFYFYDAPRLVCVQIDVCAFSVYILARAILFTKEWLERLTRNKLATLL